MCRNFLNHLRKVSERTKIRKFRKLSLPLPRTSKKPTSKHSTIMTFLKRLLNLHQGEEKKEKVIENILSNISFRGANLWILACAILIASIGLNVNSTAVIIGAMLISPLMGPIVGGRICAGYLRFRPIEENRTKSAHRYCGESYSIVYLLLYQSV